MEVTAAERTTIYTNISPLAQRVNNYIQTQHSSIAAVAKDIGYSRTTVSRYLTGKYDSNPNDLESKLTDFLTRQTGEAVDLTTPLAESEGKTWQTPVFFESRDAKAVLGVCQSCQEYIGLGIVVARSGYGKTYALRQYAKLSRVAYTRATWPNANMNDARVHYYVDDINAWQNLREDEVGWHAGDGRKATGGNETTLSIEIIMDGSGSKEDHKAEENGVLLAALLLKKHGLSVNELYTHNHWMGHPDSIVQGARKNCPLYILPHWAQFKQKVAAKLTELNGGATTTEAGKTEIMGKAKASAQQMALFARSKNAEPQLPACSLEQLVQFFLEEGEAEGVRGDVAFAQSLHETGFFKYGGIVLPTQNNYAGIGALNGNAKGQAATFPDPRTGVRAQIQHLKAYASKAALVNGCVDPRFSLVTRGSAQYVEWLGASDNPNGKGWAVPGKGYGGKIVALLGQIMAFEVPQTSAPSEPEEQEPEFPAYQLRSYMREKHFLSALLPVMR